MKQYFTEYQQIKFVNSPVNGADLGGGCRECLSWDDLRLSNTTGIFLKYADMYVFSAVHIMLLLSQKPSSSYSLLKCVYVTSQLRHSFVVHPLLRKILDPPLPVWSRPYAYRDQP